MAVTIDALRAFGERRVEVRTLYGTFAGRFVQARMHPRTLLVLLAQNGTEEDELVLALDDITEVVER